MTEEQVVSLMEGATSEQDWNKKCDQVKAACGGYPDFWYREIVLSGLAGRVAASFGVTAEIKISPISMR